MELTHEQIRKEVQDIEYALSDLFDRGLCYDQDDVILALTCLAETSIELRKLGEENKQLQKFERHLERCSEIIASWPDWKKEAMGTREHKRPEGCTCGIALGTLCGIHDFEHPDIPLNVQVAKALGKEVTIVNGAWLYKSWAPIPDYPHNLKATIKALEEYCDSIRMATILTYTKNGWQVNMGDIIRNKSLPLAICHAIIKHAAQEK
jgi:hypothetical protein